MNVFVAHIVTESSDHYTYVFANRPTRDSVIKRVWESEGKIETLGWYRNTTSVDILEEEVLQCKS
jgi:hypothetical protein